MGDETRTEISAARQIGIIGTGPLSLLKALFLSKHDPQAEITLIDSASQTGGAWYSDYSPKGHLIECGCHIWSYTPLAYHFIENDLGVKLFAMRPAPIFVGKYVALPYSVKNTLDTYKIFFKHLILLKLGQLKEVNKMPKMQYRVFGKKNKYPLTGSPELIHALDTRISANSKIRILLNTSITEIELGKSVVLSTSAGRMKFDKVYLTYVSHLRQLVLPEKTITNDPKRVDYIHFLVSSNKPFKKKISYWRFIADPVVHRITDISYQTGFDENLLLVGIKQAAFENQSENQLFEHVSSLLTTRKLVDTSHTLKLVKTHRFPTYYMHNELLEVLATYKNQIESLHTTDLMYGMHYLLRAETPHLINTPR